MMRLPAGDIEIPTSEVVAFIDPDPANPYGRGTGIAKSLGDELETDEFAAKHLKSFFYNRARPDLIISSDGMSREDTVRMEERWLDKHEGFWQAFKPHFLNKKVDIKELGQSFENMQMIQLRKHERDTVIQVFGLPPEKFGIINESKRSTIAAADHFWKQDAVFPRIEFMRTVLQDALVPQFDERLILSFEAPVVQDAEHKLNIMRNAAWAFTRNEWREEAHHDPVEIRGDVYAVPVNMQEVPADEEPLPPAPPTPPGTGGQTGDGEGST